MMDETLNDPLKQLEGQLDVTPSPEFAAKVRMRVAGEPIRDGSTVLWWAVASSGLAAAVLVIILWPAQVVAPIPTASNVPAFEIRPPAVEAIPPVVSAPARPMRPISTAKAIEREEPAVVQYGNVLVPGDQAMALDMLLAGVRSGRVAVPAGPAPLVELPAWKDIQITPVQLEPLLDLMDTEGDE
jgi:hypothetical protein